MADAEAPTKTGLEQPDPPLTGREGPPGSKLIPHLPPHLRLLLLVLVLSLSARLFGLDRPVGALIFDEKYYVNAARVIAGEPARDDTYVGRPSGLDPNTEHPPLAKLVVAASIRAFGDNAYGWRIPSVIFGMLSIALLYATVRRLDPQPEVAVLAAAIFALDSLVFTHSRIFTLDIFQVGFMLLGTWLYLANRPVLAGLGFALASLAKIGGVAGLGAIVLYEAFRVWRSSGPRRAALGLASQRVLLTSLVFGTTFLLLLGLMDRLWVGYDHPVAHLQRILTYGSALRREAGPAGAESYPWQWLWNEQLMVYLKVEQRVSVGAEVRETRNLVLFQGAMNPYVLALLPPGLAFAAWAWWRQQPGSNAGAFALALFLATFLPYVVIALATQRIMYIFYFLPALPAVAVGGSLFMLRSTLPGVVRWSLLGAVLLGFVGYFPFKPVA